MDFVNYYRPFIPSMAVRFLIHQTELKEIMGENQRAYAEKMKTQYDKHDNLEFCPGTLVMVYNPADPNSMSSKLSSNYVGPYEIGMSLKDGRFRLRDTQDPSRHRLANVQFLKRTNDQNVMNEIRRLRQWNEIKEMPDVEQKEEANKPEVCGIGERKREEKQMKYQRKEMPIRSVTKLGRRIGALIRKQEGSEPRWVRRRELL